jgi:hypothetical protein
MNENQIEIVMQACYAICAIHGALRELVDVTIESEQADGDPNKIVDRLKRVREQL